MSSQGTKVTSTTDTKPEAVGVVTSDSLAGASLKHSGSFGEGNPKAATSKQPSQSTTTNTTDISSATKLDPTSTSAARDDARAAQEGWSEASQLNAAKGLGKDSGVGPTYNTGGTGGSSGGSEGFIEGGGQAPTGGYAGASEQAREAGELRPHGANLTETKDLQGKHAFGEIGTENDPGRAAELKFAKSDALSGAAASMGKDATVQDGGSKFSGLGEERA